ncbi:hypothetical protein [Aquibacillus saliphilus]|uniref:hypothetical protein n=1 Tax=Aquibacillus saliphilus TaxID=1909422 RepID=UPI001CEFC5C8|nr:hypothetical protein [Aquibacillus saliphilus]
MVYEINKLINSNISSFNRIGWFLYTRDLENGLSGNDIQLLIELLLEEEVEINNMREEDRIELANSWMDE